jgi:hypothetical protein
VRYGATCPSDTRLSRRLTYLLNRWRKTGIWDRLMDAIVQARGGNVPMIDRAHASACLQSRTKVEIVVWSEAAAASR